MSGRACSHCGSTDGVRLYTNGPRCPDCTPAALAGRKEPDADAYCPPRICWHPGDHDCHDEPQDAA